MLGTWEKNFFSHKPLTCRFVTVQMYTFGGSMDSQELTTQQAESMRNALIPCVRYLYKLQTRMEKTGFPASDELFQATRRAYDAAQELCMKLHYLSCKSGVGIHVRDEPPSERSSL
jgi:hypothetical protein